MIFETTLFAAEPSTPQAQGFGMLPLILIFVIFYFLLIRPQQKQLKKHRELIASLKKGDKVLTSSGIYGTITELDESSVTLKISENCNVKFTKSSVIQILK